MRKTARIKLTDGNPRRSGAPSPKELLAASRRVVPDLIDYDLKVLFCGINPGLYSAWARHHFARPGNRFWPALYAAGFTSRLLKPEEEGELLRSGFGLTNLVKRATVGSGELSASELRQGGLQFARKVRKYQPKAIAILGVSAYRLAFGNPSAQLGPQTECLGSSLVWVLPNPSGLNAHFTPPALARAFIQFRLAVLKN